VIAAAAPIGLVLSGCASSMEVTSLADMPHVHNVAIVGDSVFVGSHEGLYEFVSGDRFVRVSPPFDVMGLAAQEGRFFASGHPGPGFDFPDPLGLLSSVDGGATWSAMSLTGDVDFHRLEVSGDTIVGAAANYQMIVVSEDGGLTWSSLDIPGVYDFALHPKRPATIVVATDDGLAVSDDGGRRFTPLDGPPGAVLVDWSNAGLAVATADTVWLSTGVARPFRALDVSFDSIIDLVVSGSTVAVLGVDTVSVSRDGGATFTTR